jgi:predicted nucleotidyltransferase
MKTQIINPDNIPSIEEMSQFLTNLENISYHESIVSKALKISKAIPEVEAVFLFGSLSMGNADIFSDIDFYLLHEDKTDYKDIMDSFLAEIDTLGDIIHIFQSNAKKNSIIIYLKPFIKFELVVESYSKLSTEWRLAKRARLLYDKIGLGEKVIKESKREKLSLKPHLDEIRNLALDLPSFCFLISGYMMRGEYITIIDFVAWIRRKLLRISGFMLGLWDEGTRRAEQRFPEELIRYYERCKVKDIDDVWECLLVFLEWYSDWLVPKFEEHNIIHANQEVSIIQSAIVKLRELFHDNT